MKVGFIGAGWISRKMSRTMEGLKDVSRCRALTLAMGLDPEKAAKGGPIEKYAVAARDYSRAQAFACEEGFQKAYGSYEELVNDPEVDLVYVATPHSHHHDHALLALQAGKAVLVEKAFAANYREASEVIDCAQRKQLLCVEAVWTRFMPLSHKICELLREGTIGTPILLDANLCYRMTHKERVMRPALCGGALLDIGVYCINFARMYFGTDHRRMTSSCVVGETGVDVNESITLAWDDGKMANLQSSALCGCHREGFIAGTEGYIRVDNINCPEKVTLYQNFKPVAEYYPPKEQVTGYEYEVLACQYALGNGLTETPFMPHQETLAIMALTDTLRKEWGVTYPADR